MRDEGRRMIGACGCGISLMLITGSKNCHLIAYLSINQLSQSPPPLVYALHNHIFTDPY